MAFVERFLEVVNETLMKFPSISAHGISNNLNEKPLGELACSLATYLFLND